VKADELKKKLDKRFPQAIYTGEGLTKVTVPRIASGSFMFDVLTGGGIPVNRFTEFHGPRSVGKSTFALIVAREFIKNNPDRKVVYADFEKTWDWDYSSKFIDKEHVHMFQPDYGEEGIDILLEYAKNADDAGLVIVDSVSHITATAETEGSATDNPQRALNVKLINRMIRMLIPPMSAANKAGRPITVLLLNQARVNMNAGPYGSPYSSPGGEFLKHALTMDIAFYTAKLKKSKEIPYYATHKFMVDKNKVGIPKRTGEMSWYIADFQGHTTGEIDENEAIVAYAKRAGLILREGAKWVIPTKKEPLVFGSALELLKAMSEDPKLNSRLKAATIRECVANPFIGAAADDKDTD